MSDGEYGRWGGGGGDGGGWGGGASVWGSGREIGNCNNAHVDNYIKVYNTTITEYPGTYIGNGNTAGGSNTINVADSNGGNYSGNNNTGGLGGWTGGWRGGGYDW